MKGEIVESGVGGSEIGLECCGLKKNKQLWEYLPAGQYVWHQKGRDCIDSICRMAGLRGKEILMPPFYCRNGVEAPLLKNNVSIKHYAVEMDKGIRVDLQDLEKKITKKTAAVFIIHYFGFPQPVEAIKELCDMKKVLFIEDCAQSFLSTHDGRPFGSHGQFSFFSFRKTVGLPNGALLCIRDRGYAVPLSQTNEKSLGLSRYLLERFDYQEIIRRRRENFEYLLKNVDNFEPIFKKLPEGVCPLFFPIRADKPQELAFRLSRMRLFCPIHWNPNPIGLSVPCDQRYGRCDLEYVAGVLNGI